MIPLQFNYHDNKKETRVTSIAESKYRNVSKLLICTRLRRDRRSSVRSLGDRDGSKDNDLSIHCLVSRHKTNRRKSRRLFFATAFCRSTSTTADVRAFQITKTNYRKHAGCESISIQRGLAACPFEDARVLCVTRCVTWKSLRRISAFMHLRGSSLLATNV